MRGRGPAGSLERVEEVIMTAHDHSSLPLRDYDHLPLAALGHRIRPLTADELGQLLAYEREHANRPIVVQLVQSRLAELAAGQPPSDGERQDGPEWPQPPSGTSQISPATAAPPVYPPPHGNPAQAARPKANRQAP
jgi:hypothetical protein